MGEWRVVRTQAVISEYHSKLSRLISESSSSSSLKAFRANWWNLRRQPLRRINQHTLMLPPDPFCFSTCSKSSIKVPSNKHQSQQLSECFTMFIHRQTQVQAPAHTNSLLQPPRLGALYNKVLYSTLFFRPNEADAVYSGDQIICNRPVVNYIALKPPIPSWIATRVRSSIALKMRSMSDSQDTKQVQLSTLSVVAFPPVVAAATPSEQHPA